jgi:excisionase family DNA binding protein
LAEPLLTVDQAAEYLAVSRPTVYRLVKRESLPVVRVASDFRFRVSDIERWLDGRLVAK